MVRFRARACPAKELRGRGAGSPLALAMGMRLSFLLTRPCSRCGAKVSCPEKTGGARLIPGPAGITVKAPRGAPRSPPSWWTPYPRPPYPTQPHPLAPKARPNGPPFPYGRAPRPALPTPFPHPAVSTVSTYEG